MSLWKATHVVTNANSGGREGAYVFQFRDEFYTERGWDRGIALQDSDPDYFRPIHASDIQKDLLVRLRGLAKKLEGSPDCLIIYEAINTLEASQKREAKVLDFVNALDALTKSG